MLRVINYKLPPTQPLGKIEINGNQKLPAPLITPLVSAARLIQNPRKRQFRCQYFTNFLGHSFRNGWVQAAITAKHRTRWTLSIIPRSSTGKAEFNGNTMLRRVFGMVAVLVGAAVMIYFTWAAHRVSPYREFDPSFPRPAPYPDPWLVSLHEYYDAKYPAPRGCIKLHGELPRVWEEMCFIKRAGTAVFVAGAAALAAPHITRLIKKRRHGFEVILHPN